MTDALLLAKGGHCTVNYYPLNLTLRSKKTHFLQSLDSTATQTGKDLYRDN